MHPGALATEIQFTAWRAKEGRCQTRTRTVTKIHSGTKPARLQGCSSRLRIISVRRVVGGSTAVPPAASSCKVPFFHRGEGGWRQPPPGECQEKEEQRWIRILCGKCLDMGPNIEGAWVKRVARPRCRPSLPAVWPWSDLVVQPARLPASPGGGLFGHVTRFRVTWPQFWSRDHLQGGRTALNSSTKFSLILPRSANDNSKWRQKMIPSANYYWMATPSTSSINLLEEYSLLSC